MQMGAGGETSGAGFAQFSVEIYLLTGLDLDLRQMGIERLVIFVMGDYHIVSITKIVGVRLFDLSGHNWFDRGAGGGD